MFVCLKIVLHCMYLFKIVMFKPRRRMRAWNICIKKWKINYKKVKLSCLYETMTFVMDKPKSKKGVSNPRGRVVTQFFLQHRHGPSI